MSAVCTTPSSSAARSPLPAPSPRPTSSGRWWQPAGKLASARLPCSHAHDVGGEATEDRFRGGNLPGKVELIRLPGSFFFHSCFGQPVDVGVPAAQDLVVRLR